MTTPIGSWRRMLKRDAAADEVVDRHRVGLLVLIDRYRSIVWRPSVMPMVNCAPSAIMRGWPASAMIVSTRAELCPSEMIEKGAQGVGPPGRPEDRPGFPIVEAAARFGDCPLHFVARCHSCVGDE